jgi:threonine dehydrogenase-like Zn-dependent dehydrogenase
VAKGIGADSVLECVGTQESMMQAIRSARPGGFVSYVGVPQGVELDLTELFFAHVHGGPAPVRRYLPELINLVLNEKIDPGKFSIWRCLSIKSPRGIVQWTSVGRSRHCFVHRRNI